MRKIVVLTGAGMSAESGLSTFRDSDGLWANYRVEDVATPEGWLRDPQLVLDFYNSRRKELLDASPNEGHLGLARLEKENEVYIITQNVDNLHERGGSTRVLHLHGELMKVRSTGDDRLVYDLPADNYITKLGDVCEKGYQLRPHIVWFGEAVPLIEKAIDWVKEANVFIIIGTSLNVYPAAGLIAYVRSGVPIYLIDPKEVKIPYNYSVRQIKKGASEGVEMVSAEIESL